MVPKPRLFLTGILGWGLYSILENAFSAICLGKYHVYYLLTSGLWLLLGLLASLLLYGLTFLVERAIRPMPMAPISVPAFIVLAPACFYCLIQLTISMPGNYHSLPNMTVNGLALVVFLFLGAFLGRAWGHDKKISLLDGAAYNLLFGGFGVSGTLLVTCELRREQWPLKVGLIFAFGAVLPTVIVVLLRKTRSVRRFICVLIILAFAIALEERYIGPFIHGQAFAQAKNKQKEMTRPPANAPNIVLIVVDSLRAKSMSSYGYKRATTPNLDIFCRDSVKFLNAFSSAPWTLPSMASLFTGHLGYIHSADHETAKAIPGSPLSETFDTLAELLGSAGYKTAGVVANQAYLAPWTGLGQGFDYYWWGRSRDQALLASILSSLLSERRRSQVSRFCGFDTDTSAGRINQITAHWLRSKKNHPFFLFINYMETHGRAYLPPRFAGLFTFPPAPSFPERTTEAGYQIAKREHTERLRSWYDNEIACVDGQIGNFLKILKKINAYDGTLIIITSDHGELLGEHDDFGHEFWLYEELLDIPLMVKYPLGRLKNSIDKKPIQNIDVFAEILSVAKISIPGDVQGQPFQEAHHPIISEVRRIPAAGERWPERYDHDLEAIIPLESPAFKLIRSSRGSVELFNIDDDPEELNGLRDDIRKQAILQQLDSYLSALNPIRQRYGAHLAKSRELDEMTKKRLRALGYVK